MCFIHVCSYSIVTSGLLCSALMAWLCGALSRRWYHLHYLCLEFSSEIFLRDALSLQRLLGAAEAGDAAVAGVAGRALALRYLSPVASAGVQWLLTAAAA